MDKKLREELRQLVDSLPEEKITTAKRLLALLKEGGGSPPEDVWARLYLLERLVDCLPDATLAVDREGRVLVWNRALEEMTGVKKEEILGKGNYAYALPFYGIPRPILVDILLGNGQEWEQEYDKIERKGHILVGEGFAPCAYRGKGLYFWTLVAPIRDSQGNLLGAVQCIRDISERKRMEEELRFWSTRDALTGLYNRAFFEEELRRQEKARSYPISLVLCDVDGLKIVNDMLGHEKGDELLRRVARILKNSVRETDIVARVGGDEFAIILPHTGKKAAEEVAQRVIKAAEKAALRHRDLPLSVSVGVACAEDGSQPLREIYRVADDAMYMNKLATGRDPRAAIINAFRAALLEKDVHNTERMKEMVCRLGEAVGLTREEVDNLRLLVDVHDIGKLAVPNSILFKPGPLTVGEWEEIRRHPEVGYRIALSSGELARVSPFILSHHERWDGTGYPQGLAGDEIPLLSRIFALVDAYDAMTVGRPYRAPLTHREALEELMRAAGSQFDPHLLNVFVELFSSHH